MPELSTYDYAIVRVVPRVEWGEFVNAGIILSCPEKKLLEARIALNEVRLTALYPDIDAAMVNAHLATIPAICQGDPDSGPIGKLSQRERFHWLCAPRSTIIQTSPVHSGRCSEPIKTLDRLVHTMTNGS